MQTEIATLDFHALSRSVQERFTACVVGRQTPSPMLQERVRSRASIGWTALVVVGASALAAFVAHGFGDLGSGAALHGRATIFVYGLAIAAIAFGAVRLAILRMHANALPFPRGIYVFPLDLVDARDEVLRVRSLATVASVRNEDDDPRIVRIAFADGAVFRFVADGSEEAYEAALRIARARDEARTSLRDQAPRITWTFLHDPLRRPRVSSPLGPRAPLSRRLPRWTERAWILAPLAGMLLAPPLRLVRNAASDARMFARADAAADAVSYRAYLARGGHRAEEVQRVKLPRAELADAIREGTVDAIDRFVETHPNNAIGREIADARRAALLAALERAKARGTVAALHDFAKRWPDHGLDPELRDAMHGLFAPALASYRKKPMQDDHVREFVERLFAWSEEKAAAGSAATTIQIRFRRAPSPTLRKADKMVASHHWFLGEASYPSRYFDVAHAAPREKKMAEAIGRRLRESFGPTVFTVEEGPRLEDGDGPLPEVTEPTIFITHGETWLGRFDGSITKPRGVWVALTLTFEAQFVIPGDRKPLSVALEDAEPIPYALIREHPAGGTSAAPLERAIYGTMADAAFRKFQEKYLRGFLPLQGSG